MEYRRSVNENETNCRIVGVQALACFKDSLKAELQHTGGIAAARDGHHEVVGCACVPVASSQPPATCCHPSRDCQSRDRLVDLPPREYQIQTIKFPEEPMI